MFHTLCYKDGDDVISLKPSCARAIHDELQDMFEVDWLDEVRREKAKRGEGLNKLRTYARFKSVLKVAPNLLHVPQRNHMRVNVYCFLSFVLVLPRCASKQGVMSQM